MSTVLAIGNFDGVHRGHQAILREARRIADDCDPSSPLIAVTFWPHPLSILRPAHAPALLCHLSERIELLNQAGADRIETVEFNPEVAAWTPDRFVEEVLAPLEPRAVVVGQNFHFGAGAQADGGTLRDLAGDRFLVTTLPMLCDVGDVEPVSSSRIRAALAAGDPQLAARMLGRLFRFTGVVVVGDQRGRTLGFPTANLVVPPLYASPVDGVYAGYLCTSTDRWPAAISVGANATFNGTQRRVEAYAIDQTGLDLYGVRVGVDFVARLRDQRRFESAEELIDQMNWDVVAARDITPDRGVPSN